MNGAKGNSFCSNTCTFFNDNCRKVASIKRELGGKWATIMVVNQCAVAWLCALLVRLVAVAVF